MRAVSHTMTSDMYKTPFDTKYQFPIIPKLANCLQTFIVSTQGKGRNSLTYSIPSERSKHCLAGNLINNNPGSDY